MQNKEKVVLKYNRVLLKLSGESLVCDTKLSDCPDSLESKAIQSRASLFDSQTTMAILRQIKQLVELKVVVGIVVGGGNIFRGLDKSSELGLQRVNADYMGMLATLMNGIALKDFLSKIGVNSQIYSAVPFGSVVCGYNRDTMLADLECSQSVAIFVGGTANPLFTTDSAAAIKAVEMNADLLIKATKVDGVYDMDPLKHPQAIKYAKLSFNEAISANLKIMDMAAFDLCRLHNMKIQVCNVFTTNVLKDIVCGQNIGTHIYNDEN